MSGRLSVIVHALVGWAICGATIAIGRQVVSMQTTLWVHAVVAPVAFALLTRHHFSRFPSSSAANTAVVMLAIVVGLDAGLVAPAIERSYAMFRSVLGTWVPFASIFVASYAAGRASRQAFRVETVRGELRTIFTRKPTNRGRTSGKLRCSFCNKEQSEVRKLIAGPDVFVCDECVRVCVDMIEDESGVGAEGRDPQRAEASTPPAPGVGPASAPCLVCESLTPTAALLWIPDRGGVCYRCAAEIEEALAARESDSNS